MAGALAIRRRGGKRPGGRSGECRLQLVGQVGAFPRESIAVRLAAEMAIGGGFAIDRLVEAKVGADALGRQRSEEHTSELQSLMRISYAVFCLKKKKRKIRA